MSSDHTPTSRRDNGGDAFRARLADLNWVRTCGPVELRHALHALCWRLNRDTVDGFCIDPHIAQKVLITARGVKAELQSRAQQHPEDSAADSSLRKRISSAEAVILACQVAVDLHNQSRTEDPAVAVAAALVRAITAHRRALEDEPLRDADAALWRALDETQGAALTDRPASHPDDRHSRSVA